MKHYLYHQTLKDLWEHAVKTYESGNREPKSYVNEAQLAWMEAIGMKIMDLYDFAEDQAKYGEPDFETFLMIHEVRRDYFLNILEKEWSDVEIKPEQLPSKEDSVEDIPWLPRLLPKAKAKLRGELSPELMYCCGGDRKFFKENDIHPAEFLRVVWANLDNDAGTIAWVKARRGD